MTLFDVAPLLLCLPVLAWLSYALADAAPRSEYGRGSRIVLGVVFFFGFACLVGFGWMMALA